MRKELRQLRQLENELLALGEEAMLSKNSMVWSPACLFVRR